MDINQIFNEPCSWLCDDGPECDIVITSRIRLARNIDGFSFVSRMSETDRKGVIKNFFGAAERIFANEDIFFSEMDALSELDHRCLLERQLISPEFIDSPLPRAILVGPKESFSIMINEEDHIRMHATAGGLRLLEIWQTLNDIDDRLEKQLPSAFSEKYGYLTTSPTDVGTGLRASLLLHLPGLAETGELDRFLRSMVKIGIAVRSFYGEGMQSIGAFYQISNQISLGKSEDELLDHIENLLPKIIEYEKKGREHLLETQRETILDQIYRALGILSRARRISMFEAMGHLSSLRLGLQLGLQNEVPLALINDLTLHIQPAHLQKLADREFLDDEEDIFRAEYLCRRLA